MEYYLNIIITRFLLGWCLVVALALKAKCQSNVEAQNVDVTYNKTSSIVFPAIIKVLTGEAGMCWRRRQKE